MDQVSTVKIFIQLFRQINVTLSIVLYCIFFNKNAYVLFLADNDLCNELFGADLEAVLTIGYDGRDQQSWNNLALDIFGVSLEDINEIEKEMMICDDTQINWEISSSELLENLNETFEEEYESDAEIENDIPTLSEALDQMSGLRKLALSMGKIDVLEQVSHLSSLFEREFLENRNKCRQTRVTDFFIFK